MELWDLYNKDRQLTGRTMLPGSEIPEGFYRQAVHVCFFNSFIQMLIQKRQAIRASWPGCWDLSAGGFSQSGQSSWQSAQKECWQVLGIKVDLKGQAPILTFSYPQDFEGFYIVHKDEDLRLLRLQLEAVSQVAWASEEEILLLMDKGAFVPYHKSLISLLFSLSRPPSSLSL